MSLITLTTDFGLQDWFVGTMKGVILGLNPTASIVDITHEVAPGDLQAAAFALAAAYRFFPHGTVHVAVVDPGVGSARAAIAVATGHYTFVGPDNGVLSLALTQAGKPVRIRRLENRRYLLREVSRTFHGRDIFAPVAAHLSKGVPIEELGPRVKDYKRLSLPASGPAEGGLQGTVIYLDHFGNAITNLREDLPLVRADRAVQVRLRGRRSAIPLCPFYHAVPEGAPLAIIGSSGFLEIAVNGRSAARELRLRVGDRVWLRASVTPRK